MNPSRWSRAQTRFLSICVAFCSTFSAGAGILFAQEKPTFAKWEKEIAAFERQDKEKAPPREGIVFVGSSTIRFWDLQKSFPELNALNRGFGGSQLADSVHFAPRIVLKYEPRVVVLYAGDNDLAGHKTPEQVFTDFQAFATLIHKELPKTKLIYISIKPSVKRWSIWDQAQKTNALIEAYCKQDQRCVYVDVAPVILGKDGKPQADLFIKDGLHLNEKGYALVA
ncbi:MAG TPA: SGNH/GDSL hydrolase family protein, partial [Gemmataceae bacterium]|nr:SGNH/GDSL hydrolase family protein [Gemmataceae bacterium]